MLLSASVDSVAMFSSEIIKEEYNETFHKKTEVAIKLECCNRNTEKAMKM